MLRASTLGLIPSARSTVAVQQCRVYARVRMHALLRANSTHSTPDSQPAPPVQSSESDANFFVVEQTMQLLVPFPDAFLEGTQGYIPGRPVSSAEPVADSEPSSSGSDIPVVSVSKILKMRRKRRKLSFPRTPVVQQAPGYHVGKPVRPPGPEVVQMPDTTKRTLVYLKGIAKQMRRDDVQERKQSQAAFRQLPDALEELLMTLGHSTHPKRCWEAYTFLVDLISQDELIRQHLPHVPFAYLHRLFRVISRTRPKVRQQYLKLISITTYLRHCGGNIHTYEWNTIIDWAGSGVRQVHQENMEMAWSIFYDMQEGRLPGSQSIPAVGGGHLVAAPVEPDIVTFSTLLNIAINGQDGTSIRKILGLMDQAKIRPDRLVHLMMLKYFVMKGNYEGLRKTLDKMRRQGMSLGLDGVNACLWAFGQTGRLDNVIAIYHILSSAESDRPCAEEEEELDMLRADLDHECITIEPGLRPNHVTYVSMVQILAYHGQFDAAVDVLRDFLSASNTQPGAPLLGPDLIPGNHQPSLPLYRALFLGFARHGHSTDASDIPSSWTLQNFLRFFKLLESLPRRTKIDQFTLYTILTACDKVTGEDETVKRTIWTRLDERFGVGSMPNLRGRLLRFKEMVSDEVES